MSRIFATIVAIGCLFATGSPAAASGTAVSSPLIDCPLRDAPYSTATPLIDILLNERAKAVANKALPGIATRLPPRIAGTTPPTFAAILTLKEAAGFLRMPTPHLAAIDRELSAIPVTRADKIARCARYDTVPPHFDLPQGRPRVLLFEKINGFRDVPSVDGARAAFIAMAERNGWALVATDKGSAFTPAVLAQFDAVIWNNISGDVLTLSQRDAFRNWMEAGGGFVGVHGTAGDPVYFWDWYVDGLLGARFLSHPMDPQYQTAQITIEDATHPIARGLPREWEMKDEWYSFKTNPREAGARIIATLDESTYVPEGRGGMSLRMGDHPIAWTRCIGTGPRQGRMFYSAIGHLPERYSDPVYVQMLEQGVAWAAGQRGGDCRSTE